MSKNQYYQALKNKGAILYFDHMLAFDYSIRALKAVLLVQLLEYVPIIVFIIYIFINKQWLALLLLPVIFSGFTFFSPSFKKFSGYFPVIVIHSIIIIILYRFN